MTKKNIRKILLFLFATVIIYILLQDLSDTTLAQYTLPKNYKPDFAPDVGLGEAAKSNPANYLNLILNTIAGGLLVFAAPIAIIIITIGGVTAIVSHGKQEIIDKAKKTLFGAIIGLLIIIFSWVIIRAIVDLILTTGSNQRIEAEAQTESNEGSDTGSKADSATGDKPQ